MLLLIGRNGISPNGKPHSLYIGGIIACAGPQKLQEMSIYIECKEGDCLEFP